MSNCETIRDDLKAYADGQLALLRQAEITLHLAGCVACRQEIEAMRRISACLHAQEAEPLDLDVRAKILERVSHEDASKTDDLGVLPGRRS
jgi:anti-sigma factor RsiW